MPSLLEQVARARDKRHQAEAEFRVAIVNARAQNTWKVIADVAGLSYSGVRYLAARKNGSPDA